jgi:hypothetical protein
MAKEKMIAAPAQNAPDKSPCRQSRSQYRGRFGQARSRVSRRYIAFWRAALLRDFARRVRNRRNDLCPPAVSISIDPVLINPAKKSVQQFAHGAPSTTHPLESQAGGLAPWFAFVAA